MQKKYLEIKDYLMERIRSGEYKPEQAIPAERELAAQLGVSRMTVRKAIEELMYEGLLIRRKGSGTFLTTAKSSKPGKRCQDRQLQALLRGQLWLQDAGSRSQPQLLASAPGAPYRPSALCL